MEYCSADEEYLEQQDYLHTCLMPSGLETVFAYNEAAYHRFVRVLPEESIQGLALACQNQINILSRQGDKTAATIPYRRLNDDRPKMLVQILYDILQESGHLSYQRGQYVIRVLEGAFLDLVRYSE